MNQCKWCDAPTIEKLCTDCRAVHDGPVFVCEKPNHLRTLGTACAECEHIAARAKERAERNAPIIASLRAIRAAHVRDWHKPWPGMEHGKGIIGQCIDLALADLA